MTTVPTSTNPVTAADVTGYDVALSAFRFARSQLAIAVLRAVTQAVWAVVPNARTIECGISDQNDNDELYWTGDIDGDHADDDVADALNDPIYDAGISDLFYGNRHIWEPFCDPALVGADRFVIDLMKVGEHLLSPTQLDMQAIVALLASNHGLDATIMHTGGGCATIEMAPYDAEGYPTVQAGPGTYVDGQPNGATLADPGDFYIGDADNGDDVPAYEQFIQGNPAVRHEAAAAQIAAAWHKRVAK